MTAVGHDVTVTKEESGSGAVYWRSRCSCGHHEVYALAQMSAARLSGYHLEVVADMDKQAQGATT